MGLITPSFKLADYDNVVIAFLRWPALRGFKFHWVATLQSLPYRSLFRKEQQFWYYVRVLRNYLRGFKIDDIGENVSVHNKHLMNGHEGNS